MDQKFCRIYCVNFCVIQEISDALYLIKYSSNSRVLLNCNYCCKSVAIIPLLGRYVITIGGHNSTSFLSSVEIFDVCTLRRFVDTIWPMNKARAFHSCAVVSEFKTSKFGLVEAGSKNEQDQFPLKQEILERSDWLFNIYNQSECSNPALFNFTQWSIL